MTVDRDSRTVTLPEVQLGSTGLRVAVLGLGTARLDDRADAAAPSATIHHALGLGLGFVDTAECYGAGRGEAIVGQALRGAGQDCVLQTKFGHRPTSSGFSRESVVASARRSASTLGRPADILTLHTPPGPPLDDVLARGGALDGMREAKELGLCRFLGISGNDVGYLRECVATEQFDVLLVFDRLDLLDHSAEALVGDAQQAGVGVIAAGPLHGGALTPLRRQTVRWTRIDDSRRARADALAHRLADYPGGITAAAVQFTRHLAPGALILVGPRSAEEVNFAVQAMRAELPADLGHELAGT